MTDSFNAIENNSKEISGSQNNETSAILLAESTKSKDETSSNKAFIDSVKDAPASLASAFVFNGIQKPFAAITQLYDYVAGTDHASWIYNGGFQKAAGSAVSILSPKLGEKLANSGEAPTEANSPKFETPIPNFDWHMHAIGNATGVILGVYGLSKLFNKTGLTNLIRSNDRVGLSAGDNARLLGMTTPEAILTGGVYSTLATPSQDYDHFFRDRLVAGGIGATTFGALHMVNQRLGNMLPELTSSRLGRVGFGTLSGLPAGAIGGGLSIASDRMLNDKPLESSKWGEHIYKSMYEQVFVGGIAGALTGRAMTAKKEQPFEQLKLDSLKVEPTNGVTELQAQTLLASAEMQRLAGSINTNRFDVRGMKVLAYEEIAPGSAKVGEPTNVGDAKRPAFAELKLEIKDRQNEGLFVPGIVFMTPPTVAAVPVIRVPDGIHKGFYTVVTERPRVPTGSYNFQEIGAAMLRDGEMPIDAAKRIFQTRLGLGELINERTEIKSLTDNLTVELNRKGVTGIKANDGGREGGAYNSPGGTNESTNIHYAEIKMGSDQFNAFVKDTNGQHLKVEGGQKGLTQLRVIPLHKLSELQDAKSISAFGLLANDGRTGKIQGLRIDDNTPDLPVIPLAPFTRLAQEVLPLTRDYKFTIEPKFADADAGSGPNLALTNRTVALRRSNVDAPESAAEANVQVRINIPKELPTDKISAFLASPESALQSKAILNYLTSKELQKVDLKSMEILRVDESNGKINSILTSVETVDPKTGTASTNLMFLGDSFTARVSAAPGVSLKNQVDAISSKYTKAWLDRFDFENMDFRGIDIKSVEYFGPNVGFIKAKVDVYDRNTGHKLDDTMLMRGGSSGGLVVFELENPKANESRFYGAIVKQARSPIGSKSFAELMAGMGGGKKTFAQEALEELGVTPEQLKSTVALTKEGGPGKHGMFVSGGRQDEVIDLGVNERPILISREKFREMKGRQTGLKEENEAISVDLIPIEKFKTLADMKAIAAYTLYKRNYEPQMLEAIEAERGYRNRSWAISPAKIPYLINVRSQVLTPLSPETDDKSKEKK